MNDIHSYEPLWNEWYAVEPPLGRGSYGTVYKVEKRELGQCYYAAVKHLPIPTEQGFGDDLDTEMDADIDKYRDLLEDLLEEIQINNRLKGYTNIVSYEDHQVRERPNEQGYDVFIKMELLTSLPKYIHEHSMTVGDIVRMGEEMCTALTVLQRESIIHRDIKPANIFINARGDFKLGDFGVSKIMERANEGMSARGTLSYMAPEVARAEDGDYRLDLYSLGLVLHRLLNNNCPPFYLAKEGRVTRTVASQSNRRRLRGEALTAPELADEELAAIVLKACAFLPEERWSTAEEMRDALSEYRKRTPSELLNRVALEKKIDEATTGSAIGTETRRKIIEGESTDVSFVIQETSSLTADEFSRQMTSDVPPEERSESEPTSDEQIDRTVLISHSEEALIQQEEPEEVERTVLLRKPKPTPQKPEPKPMLPARKIEPPKEIPTNRDNVGAMMRAEERLPVEENREQKKSKKLMLCLIAGIAVLAIVGTIVALALSGGGHSDTVLEVTPSVTERVSSSPSPSEEPSPTPSAETGPIEWADETFAEMVSWYFEYLGKPIDEITIEDAEGLTELQFIGIEYEGAKADSIETLEDLRYFPNLERLVIWYVHIESTSGLEYAKELTNLELVNCDLDQIAYLHAANTDVIGELPKLEKLDLSGNKFVYDLDFLSGSDKLWYLNVSDTGVGDLSPLAEVELLSWLEISDTYVTDLTPLSELDELRYINAENQNNVVDWSPVDHVENVVGRPDAVEEASSVPTETPKPTAKPTSKPKNTPTPPATQTPAPTSTPTPTPQKVTVKRIVLSRDSLVLETGETASISATITSSEALNISSAVSYSVSGGCIEVTKGAASTSTDSNGLNVYTVSFSVVARNSGSATLTISCGSGCSSSCVISVA